MKLPAYDKALHCIAGILVFVIFQPIAGLAMALLMVAAAAVVKEVYDATGRGHVELADALWTVAGGLLGVAASLGGSILPLLSS